MFAGTHTASDTLSPTRAPTRPLAIDRHAPAMQVAYLGAADLGRLRMRDSLDILIPTETANLFATYRANPARDRTALVRAPLVSILPPALPHTLADRPGSNTLILSIAGDFFKESARAALGCEDVTFVEPHATADALIREVGNAVEREFRIRQPLSASYLESSAVLLAAHVARTYVAENNPKPTTTGGLPAHKMRCVCGFIADHLGETIHVDQLADAVHLSPFHFARMFKRSTGQSPHLYILMQRIKRAKELLASTDMPLVEVAAVVGFRTQGHFTGVFHRYTGFTPRMFRLNAREAQG